MARKVKNTKAPKKNIVNRTPLKKNHVSISFSYKNWIKGFSNREFSTFTETEREFWDNFIYIMYELIPYVYENWNGQRIAHCHAINDLGGVRSREAKKKYFSAIKSIHSELKNNVLLENIDNVEYSNGQLEDLELYQLGLTGSLRVICGKIGNTLYPMLIDHHHLGYDSEQHNQRDFSKFSYCPVESGK